MNEIEENTAVQLVESDDKLTLVIPKQNTEVLEKLDAVDDICQLEGLDLTNAIELALGTGLDNLLRSHGLKNARPDRYPLVVPEGDRNKRKGFFPDMVGIGAETMTTLKTLSARMAPWGQSTHYSLAGLADAAIKYYIHNVIVPAFRIADGDLGKQTSVEPGLEDALVNQRFHLSKTAYLEKLVTEEGLLEEPSEAPDQSQTEGEEE